MCHLLPVALLGLLASTTAAQGSLRVLSPSDDGVANYRRPTLRWVADSGADGYRVQVFDSTAMSLVHERTVGAVEEYTLGIALTDGSVYHVRYDALRTGQIIASSPMSRFVVKSLPRWFPELELVHRNPALDHGGYRLINLLDVRPASATRVPAIALVNEHAEVTWWYRREHSGLIQAPKVLVNGNLLYLAQWFTTLPVQGRAIEMAWDGEEVWQSDPSESVHHEITIGPDGHYLGLTWEWRVYAGAIYEGDSLTLFDRDDGTVVWEWNLFDHFTPITHPTNEMHDTGVSGIGGDWSHSNAAEWDPERGVIWMSVRHFDSLIAVEYPSGNVRTIVGKLGIGGSGLMWKQHAPEVQSDGSLLLFDNGNGHRTPYSRVIRIVLDERAGTALIAESWVDNPAFFDFAVGDADRLPNDNILVTAGVSGRLIEIAHAGSWTPVWECRFANGSNWWMYRAEWVPEERIDPVARPFSGRDYWWR